MYTQGFVIENHESVLKSEFAVFLSICLQNATDEYNIVILRGNLANEGFINMRLMMHHASL